MIAMIVASFKQGLLSYARTQTLATILDLNIAASPSDCGEFLYRLSFDYRYAVLLCTGAKSPAASSGVVLSFQS